MFIDKSLLCAIMDYVCILTEKKLIELCNAQSSRHILGLFWKRKEQKMSQKLLYKCV